MSQATISKAVDRVFAGAGFKSCGIISIEAMSDKYPAKRTDHVSEDHYFYEADTWHRTEYRFYYDYLVDFDRVSLKNSKELLYPSENEFFGYLLFPVQTRVNSNQSFNFQFTQSGLSDQIYNHGELLYRDLGFQYTFYTSLDFDNDDTVPEETMLAMVDCDGSDRFSFSISLPADKALLSSYYIKVTPVWVDGNNGKIDISPATINWNLTGLTREIQYSLNTDCSSDKLTESVRNLAGFNAEIPTMQSVLDLQSTASSFVWTESVTSLTYDPAANENERFSLVEFQLELTRCTRIAVGSVEAGMNLTRLSSVVNHPKVKTLDDLPPGTLYQQTSKIMDGFGVATGVITLYSNGLEAWKAWQNGEKVEVAYYTAKALGGGASAGLSFYKISTNVVATASKTGRFALKATDKVSIGIAAVVGAVEFSYNLYKYNSTTDPIKKSSYGEKMGSTTLDTGLAIATTFYPPLIAFSATWMLIVEVFGFFTDWGLSYKIAQTPGTAIVFLYEYWWSEEIPSQLAEEAYGFMLDTLMEHLRIMNENGVPFVPVFVDPQLE